MGCKYRLIFFHSWPTGTWMISFSRSYFFVDFPMWLAHWPMTFPVDDVPGVGLLGAMLRPLRKAPMEQRQVPENNFYYDPVVFCSWFRYFFFWILSLILDCFADQWLPTPPGHPNPGMWKWYEMMTGEAMASAGCGGCRCVQYRSQHGTSETRFGEQFWSTTHQPYDWMPYWCSITLCRSLGAEVEQFGHFGGSPKRSREATCYDFFTVPRSKCVCSPRTSDWRKMALLWGWMIADGSSHLIRLTSWPSCFHVFTQLLRRSKGYDPKPCFFLPTMGRSWCQHFKCHTWASGSGWVRGWPAT